MNRRLKKIVHFGRTAITLLVICALFASGASAAMRLFPGAPGHDQVQDQWMYAELVQGPPPPEEAGDSMADYGGPNSEPAGYAVSFILKSDSGSRSILREVAATPVTIVSTTDRAHGPPTIATASQVNSHLGRQSTLVGARPSGTS